MGSEDDAAAVVAALYQARADADVDGARRLLHPEVVSREHEGEAGYAGVHRGRDAVVDDLLGSAMAATAGAFRVELEGVVAHGPFLAAALVRWSATRGSEERSGREIGVYRVRDGQVVEASFQLEDPEATDAFFADA